MSGYKFVSGLSLEALELQVYELEQQGWETLGDVWIAPFGSVTEYKQKMVLL